MLGKVISVADSRRQVHGFVTLTCLKGNVVDAN